jgi:6-phosphogluconolactonase
MGDVVGKPQQPGKTWSVEVVEVADAAGVAQGAAARLATTLRDAVSKRGRASLALSGGNTPRDTYALLARAPDLDWSRVHVFWVDERAVGPDHERSNYRAAKTTLLEAAHVPAAQVHRMPAEDADRARAAADYEQLLRRHVTADASGVAAFDAMVLGMGDDGHTASLFPGEPTVLVTDRWVVDVPADGAREARLTLTAPIIRASLAAFVLLVGAAKHAPLVRAWATEGDVLKTPIRIVRSCRGAVTWIGDREAVASARPA